MGERKPQEAINVESARSPRKQFHWLIESPPN